MDNKMLNRYVRFESRPRGLAIENLIAALRFSAAPMIMIVFLGFFSACAGLRTGAPSQSASAGAEKRKLAYDEAAAVMHLSPIAYPFVFGGQGFPPIDFERPVEARKLIGPYTNTVTFYDAQYNQVTNAANPGRYGAIVEIKPEKGLTLRRFITLFRQPENLRWRWRKPSATFLLPKELGIDSEVAANSEELSKYVDGRVSDGFWREQDGAVLLAGLYERGKDTTKKGFYDSTWIKDREWWLGLKRKLYGWDKRWPKPFVAPRPIEGKPAPELRPGTPQEAGMKPESVKAIDELLSQWASDSDEAFSVCLARHGVIFLHKAYGTRDGNPITIDTKSWAASFTKMMSGTLWGMIFDQGRVRIDDRVDAYLPPLAHVPTTQPLTFRRLYNHTAGFNGEHWGDSANDMEERLVSLLPQLQVGRTFTYSGTDMALAGKALEAVTGETLPGAFRKHLFNPLGCQIEAADASHGGQATALGAAKLCQLHLNRGAYGPWRFFSENVATQLLPRVIKPQIAEPKESSWGEFVRYGYGIHFYGITGLSQIAFGHGAASTSIMCVDPVYDMVIVMMRNAAGRNDGKYRPQFTELLVDGIVDRRQLPDLPVLVAAVDTEADTDAGKLILDRTVTNNSAFGVEFAYRLVTRGTSWRAPDAEGRLSIPAGKATAIHLGMTFDPAEPLPTPHVEGILKCGDYPPMEVTADMRPRFRRTTAAVRVVRPPVLDGAISGGEYGNAPATSDLRSIQPGKLGGKRTWFRLAYDDQNLYVAVKADEPHADRIVTPVRVRDGDIWRDDSVEVFVDAAHDRSTYRQFLANLRGDQYDAKGGPTCGDWGDSRWNAAWQTAAKAGSDGYVIEFAISFAALDANPPKPGDVWGLNLGRTRSAQTGGTVDPRSAAWAIVYSSFHEASHFGDVLFK